MLLRPLAVLPALLVLGLYLDASRGSTPIQLLVERPSQSLRDQVIDIDDKWSGARLLAHFGENKLAYDLLGARPANEALDPQIERFEARLLTEIGLPARADSVLALQPYTSDEQAYYRLCLQRSRLNLMAGNCQRALDFLSLIDSLAIPAFAPYRDYLALECLSLLGRFDEATQVGEGRLAQGVPVSLSPRLEEHLIEAYVQSHKYQRALDLIQVLRARPTTSSAIAPILIAEVDIKLLMGDTLGAVDRAIDLLGDRRTRRRSLELTERLVNKVSLETLSDQTLLRFCGVLLRAKNLRSADRIASILSERSLSKDNKERLRLFLADLYYKEKRYSKSHQLAGPKFDDPSMERTAGLLRARIYRKTGQGLRAADEYVNFSTRYPYDAKAAEALIVASGLYLRAGDRKRAMGLLERITDTYPSHRYAKVAAKRMALYYIEHKYYSRGVEVLEAAVERSRRRGEDLLYYLADTYRRMGKSEKANRLLEELDELNPMSFYLAPHVETSFAQPIMASNGRIELHGDRGLLDFLERVFRERQDCYRAVRQALTEPSDAAGDLRAGAVYLERGRQFLQMGFRDWAEIELRTLETNHDLPARYWFELGVLYDDFAMHWKSVRAFQRVYYAVGGETRELLDRYFKLLMYPMPYPALIVENCSRYGVAPHLIYAMMREESLFDLNAVSRAGAMGLMQLMPATGDQVAGTLGFPEGVHEDLFIPEVNLTFGIWYASHLLTKTDGDPLMMLSAYNAGLGNARRWFTANRNAPAVIAMVDGIDYRETRNYVKRIVKSARVYHAFYFNPDHSQRSSLH
ncbi:MAG: transglycosylase SLT domain-containing protein [Candidatus Krumholzibacteria bacterium]|nr:transglycosylase SLT domain-containing protein [Candidatus Krumholzibacteria bacterium]